jgi:predicted enzyme related to lactoylglutathione lyase
MITTVKHAVVPILDQNRALKFYTEKLGLKVVVDAEFEGFPQRWIELKTPEGDTCVVLYTNPEHQDMIGKFSNIVFTCKDVVSTTDQLKASGVEIVEGPVEAPWGIYSIFKDSEGNRFCLSST